MPYYLFRSQHLVTLAVPDHVQVTFACKTAHAPEAFLSSFIYTNPSFTLSCKNNMISASTGEMRTQQGAYISQKRWPSGKAAPERFTASASDSLDWHWCSSFLFISLHFHSENYLKNPDGIWIRQGTHVLKCQARQEWYNRWVNDVLLLRINIEHKGKPSWTQMSVTNGNLVSFHPKNLGKH